MRAGSTRTGLDILRDVCAVVIGDRGYIGSQSVIARGVTVGETCVIAAHSFVNRDVPGRTIFSGIPTRAIGHVEGDDIRLVYAT